MVFARDPETGQANASFQRFQLQGARRTGIQINNWRHLLTFYEKAEARNEALPIAIALGTDPVVSIAAGIRTEIDEMEYAGSLRGRPMEMTPAPATGIPVPSETEIVIEGEIPPHHREAEGPLAEFTGHYSGVYQAPVFEVSAVSHRTNPIFQTIVPASLEHRNLGGSLPREPVLYKFVKHVAPNVRNVHLPPYASGFMAVISLKPEHPGQPKNVALAAMTSHVNIKVVVVVDQDVDIFNPMGNPLVPVHPRGRPPGPVHRAVFAGTRDGPLDRGRGDRDEGGDRRHAQPARPGIPGKGHVSADRPVEVLGRFLNVTTSGGLLERRPPHSLVGRASSPPSDGGQDGRPTTWSSLKAWPKRDCGRNG